MMEVYFKYVSKLIIIYIKKIPHIVVNCFLTLPSFASSLIQYKIGFSKKGFKFNEICRQEMFCFCAKNNESFLTFT